MNINTRHVALLLLAASAAIGTAFALNMRKRRLQGVHHSDLRTDIKSWENEGGNLAPPPLARAA